jgi:hypothetical protein
MAIPFLNNITLNNNEIQNVKLHNTANIPSPSPGHIYFDTDDSIAKYWDGSAWIEIVSDTNDYLDSATFAGSTITLVRTGSLSDVTVDIGSLVNDSTITITAGTALTTGGSFTTNQAANGEITIDHENVSRTDTTSTDAPSYGGTFQAVTGVTTNAQGHVTAIDVSTVTIPASDNTNTTYDISVGAGGENSSTIDLNAGGSGSGTDSITIEGTSNGVKITESVDTITVDLQDNITVDGLTVNNNVLISGNLEVVGTVTTVNETVKVVENNTIEFEGTTANDFEIKLTGGDPTADHTVTLPDASGTIALTSDINDGTLTVEGSNGLTGSGTFTANDSTSPTITISHADTSSQGSVNNSGRTYIQDITLDDYGHITAIASATETVENTDNQLATAAALIDVSAMGVNTTASFTHGLASKNLIVQMYDVTTGEVVFADVDHTSINAISIIFAQTPTNDIRVVVIDAKNSVADSTVTYS